MNYFRPAGLEEALRIKADFPEVVAVAGGTDIMVPINFGQLRPSCLMDISAIAQLRTLAVDGNGDMRIGSGVPFKRIIDYCARRAPGLAMAAMTIGSPQIRNRATLGGNLATASPAGDALPPLVASAATVTLASTGGYREMPVSDFLLAPKRSAIEATELIVSVNMPRATGPQLFSKIGTRNAMVISVSSLALELRPKDREIRCAIGSAAPVVCRAVAAERLADEIDWLRAGTCPEPLHPDLVHAFGRAVRDAANPISDVRGTSRYRRHALEVLARRNLVWAWTDLARRYACV